MKAIVTEQMFIDDIMAARPHNFSRKGLSALFDYLEQMERDCDYEMTFDAIAICCDYAEGTPEQIARDYAIDMSECDTAEQLWCAVVEWLTDEDALVGGTDEGTIVHRQV